MSLASRARDMNLTPRAMAATSAHLAAPEELPAPAALQGTVRGLTADIFRDMSASRETVAAAQGSRATRRRARPARPMAAARFVRIRPDLQPPDLQPAESGTVEVEHA